MENGRDRDGRFAPGNRGGPGRPPRSTEERYLAVITETVPPERWRAAVEAIYQRARDGDAKAFEILAKYVCPPEARSHVTVDDAREARRATVEDALRDYLPFFDEPQPAGTNGGS